MLDSIFGFFARLPGDIFNGLVGIGKIVEQKAIGALLMAILAGASLIQLSNHIFHHSEHAETAFHIAGVGEAVASAPAEEEVGLEPVSAILAAADLGAGEKLFKRCSACHTIEAGGANKVGPNLWNRVGGAKGGGEGFGYSEAITSLGGDWSYEDLNAFLADPKGYAPGTKMNFAGLRKVTDRANMIAYMRAQADSPLALP